MNRRWHRPSWFAWSLLLAGLAAFVSLGAWQWGRAAQKEALLATFATAEKAAPEAFATVADAPPEGIYPRVVVRGHFEWAEGLGYLLDEQLHGGRVGVMALAVFVPADGTRRLLVNRGWMPWSRADGVAPALPAVPQGEVTLTGLYAPPPRGGLRVGGDALRTQTHWPKFTLRADLDEIAGDIGAPVYPRLLLLDADAASGFVREWTPAVMPPERHRGYAVQWWSFAIAALVIFFALHWRKVSPGNTP